MRRLFVVLLLGACGTPPGAPSGETLHGGGPPHELVWIAPGPGVPHGFWLGRFEVSKAQFAAFVQATGYDGSEAPSSRPTEPFLGDWRDGRPAAGQEDHPVCLVNLHHARAYCRWLAQRTGRSVRLPSDAEWEWAARGAPERAWPWGDTWDPARCNWGDGGGSDGFLTVAPVGSFPAGASPEGVHDLAGNIWEWSEDGHLRGGPWCMGPETVRPERRAHEDPLRADDKFGLRIVVDPLPPVPAPAGAR